VGEEHEGLVAEIWDVLHSVMDPDVGVDVVHLGLVYGVHVESFGERLRVIVDLTLTSPTCPAAGLIVATIQTVIPGVDARIVDVDVRLVWDPPWTPERISETGKMELGLL
jgi:metal-sulfur cluster biosynthetic enzyme